jgi:hypothetical protein
MRGGSTPAARGTGTTRRDRRNRRLAAGIERKYPGAVVQWRSRIVRRRRARTLRCRRRTIRRFLLESPRLLEDLPPSLDCSAIVLDTAPRMTDDTFAQEPARPGPAGLPQSDDRAIEGHWPSAVRFDRHCRGDRRRTEHALTSVPGHFEPLRPVLSHPRVCPSRTVLSSCLSRYR